MAIANKFIHFNTEAGFENYLFTGNGSGGGFLNQEGTNFETNTYSVKPEKQEEWNKFKNYTCFIKDTQKIWTHEKFYICSGGGESDIYVIPAEFFTTEDPSTRIKIYNELRSALENSKIIYLESDGTTSIPITVYSSDDTITIEMVTSQPAENSEMMLVSVKQTFKSDGTDPIMESLHTITTGKATPKANGTASAGSSANAAREDHVHPLQTSVSGNAGTATKLATAQTISLTGDVTGSTSFDGSKAVSITTTVADNSHNHDNSTITSIDASKITSGTIAIERLPKGALERLVIVENQAARFKLTTADVQEGDTVKQEDTGVMYFVVNTAKLSSEDGYKIYTAGSATSVPWSGVTEKPEFLQLGETSTTAYAGDKGKWTTDVAKSLESDIVTTLSASSNSTTAYINFGRINRSNTSEVFKKIDPYSAALPTATQEKAGVMSAADKTALDTMEFSSINLIDGSEEIVVNAGNNNNAYIKLPINGLVNADDELAISIDEIKSSSESTSNFSIAIYSADGTIEFARSNDFTTTNKTYIFKINSLANKSAASILLYAGLPGYTGNIVTYKKVMLVRGNHPSKVWAPSANDLRNLSIGGVNLIRNAKTMIGHGWLWGPNQGSEGYGVTDDGWSIAKIYNQWGDATYTGLTLKAGQIYTFSAYVRYDTSTIMPPINYAYFAFYGKGNYTVISSYIDDNIIERNIEVNEEGNNCKIGTSAAPKDIFFIGLNDSWRRMKITIKIGNTDIDSSNFRFECATDPYQENGENLPVNGYIYGQQIEEGCVATALRESQEDFHVAIDGVKTIIDASTLDQDTYYPVTMVADITKRSKIAINVDLGVEQTGKPKWAIHSSGNFSCHIVWTTIGSGYGVNSIERIIYASQSTWCDGNIVGGVGQLTKSSNEFIYVRGGGIYYFYTINTETPILHTTGYTNDGDTLELKSSIGILVPLQAHITNLENSKLSLTGGTLSGQLTGRKGVSAFDEDETKTEFNTTGKIGSSNNYSTPLIIKTKQANSNWNFQFQDGYNLLLGSPLNIPIILSSAPSKSQLYATELYQDNKIAATQEWVKAQGYLTSIPAQSWDSITGKPSTFTPSAHTQSYTTLTGSTTTANQAIVSSGTANGWTLKTLGSNAFNSTTIPTKVSQLTNDSGFATQTWVTQQLANYVSKTGDSTITGTITATAFKEA